MNLELGISKINSKRIIALKTEDISCLKRGRKEQGSCTYNANSLSIEHDFPKK